MPSSTVLPPPRTALVLDDEAQIGAVICKVLSSIGVAAKQFTDPLEFLLEVKHSEPDILILDLALGRADAVDVIRKLEVLKFAGRVLLMSGRDHKTLAEIERIGSARGLKMMPSMRKPFRAAELKAAVQAPVESQSASPDRKPPVSENVIAKTGALLDHALKQEWLEVWYQPKIDLKALSICGAEALIRARHPLRGVIEPAELLPPAGNALYKPLTLFVIRRVAADWLTFARSGRMLKLAINVPASILAAPGFVDFMRNALPEHSQFPGLIVEITEDEVIRDIAWIHEVSTQLRLYNVSISVDDFGSAYASLSRIKDLPFGEVKLDRSFVKECGADALRRGLCQAVVELAHCVGAAACAEGVETLEDLRCLTELGFDTAQGFIFAPPMPANMFLEFIAKPQASPARQRAS